jgi:predicted GNAT family acetyltransferase
VQSVFVDRAERGRGLATQGMASVVAAALRDWAPAVTLYVNADNLAARRVYDKVGFVRTATFATVLL